MQIFRVKTKRWGVIWAAWWWPEAGLVVWVGGILRFKLWGRRCGFRPSI